LSAAEVGWPARIEAWGRTALISKGLTRADRPALMSAPLGLDVVKLPVGG
jgi:hypothetical protein